MPDLFYLGVLYVKAIEILCQNFRITLGLRTQLDGFGWFTDSARDYSDPKWAFSHTDRLFKLKAADRLYVV